MCVFACLAGLAGAMAGAVLGVAAIFVQWPEARLVVQAVGAVYLLYISWKIAFAPISGDPQALSQSTPGFRDGLILNLLNPNWI